MSLAANQPSSRTESVRYTYALFTATGGGRVFTDPDTRVAWSVFEVDATRVPGARGRPGCLLFVAEGVVRRVWHYPDAWYLLGDADLAELRRSV